LAAEQPYPYWPAPCTILFLLNSSAAQKGTLTFFGYSPKYPPGLPVGQGTGTFAADLFTGDLALQRQLVTNAITEVQLAGFGRAYSQGPRLKF
jgi:hypothetical protein